jgi:hypothetical protein
VILSHACLPIPALPLLSSIAGCIISEGLNLVNKNTIFSLKKEYQLRIINVDSAGKERNKLIREIRYSLESLKYYEDDQSHCQDIIAFVTLSLFQIWESVEITTTAWEKRGYWIKADKFRMQWFWTYQKANSLVKLITIGDYSGIENIIEDIKIRIGDVKISNQLRSSISWTGSMESLTSKFDQKGGD